MLKARMWAVLLARISQGVRIISNIGGANPLAVLSLSRELGLPQV